MRKFFKKLDYRHYVCATITLIFVALTVFIFPHCVLRLFESIRDVGVSIAFFFARLFRIPNAINPTVTELSNVAYFNDFTFVFPETFAEFEIKWSAYWSSFVSKQNVTGYIIFLVNVLYYLLIAVFILAMVLLIVFFYFRLICNEENNDYDKDSKPLKVFKSITLHIYVPIKAWLKGFVYFIKTHKAYKVTWLVLWLINLNVGPIVLGFIAYIFYFAMSLDFGSLYTYLYKLILDLSVGLHVVPLPVIIIFVLWLINKRCKSIGYNRLNHNEMKNRGFINSLPKIVLNCGTMGAKKTMMLTDMALSQEVMFLDKAKELMLNHTLKFPNFPWINLENEVKRKVYAHEVYNLATCRKYVDRMQSWFDIGSMDRNVAKSIRRYLKRREGYKCSNLCYGYDYDRYGLTYDDKLFYTTIWDSIKSYVQLYFIYTLKTSFLIFNYSVRSSNVMIDKGNFPLWYTDFFERDSDVDSCSSYAHIIDFDALRFGKKVKEDNPLANFFEFGVVGITEIGKDRMNMLELKNVKKESEDTNQKNDLFASWLKMIRHSATVDYECFARVFSDEQRQDSLGVDIRELAYVLGIDSESDTRLARPLFFVMDLFYDFVISKFRSLFYTYRHNRGDNTLLFHVFKTITAKLHGYYVGVYNTFAYDTVCVNMQRGGSNEVELHKYYLSHKKIRSKRYSTDCYSDFLTVKALRSDVGLDDVPCYSDVKATFEELASQNSYFVRDLLEGIKGDTNKNEEVKK